MKIVLVTILGKTTLSSAPVELVAMLEVARELSVGGAALVEGAFQQPKDLG